VADIKITKTEVESILKYAEMQSTVIDHVTLAALAKLMLKQFEVPNYTQISEQDVTLVESRGWQDDRDFAVGDKVQLRVPTHVRKIIVLPERSQLIYLDGVIGYGFNKEHLRHDL